jgi:hypothetical protein
MKKNIQRVFVLACSLLLTVSLAGQAQALNLWGDPFANDVGYNSFNAIGMGKTDPRTIAANVINFILGLLGVIAIVIILFGGFKWMTAMGNDDNVAKAKALLGAGIIGLLIVLAAYAVSIYIIRTFLASTGANFENSQTELDTGVYGE